MSKTVRLEEMSGVFEEVLESGGEVTFVTAGISMYPLLRNRKDKVFLRKPDGKLKKYDVPLFRRAPSGQFVLHRVMKIRPDGYVLRGDNQWVYEYGIKDEQVVGVAVAFERNGKKIECSSLKYKLYCLFLPIIRNAPKYFYKCTDKLFALRAKIFKKNS